MGDNLFKQWTLKLTAQEIIARPEFGLTEREAVTSAVWDILKELKAAHTGQGSGVDSAAI